MQCADLLEMIDIEQQEGSGFSGTVATGDGDREARLQMAAKDSRERLGPADGDECAALAFGEPGVVKPEAPRAACAPGAPVDPRHGTA